ncbi:MAG: hypothetical protein SGILL_006768, partial [Bacillariaceae sp.]
MVTSSSQSVISFDNLSGPDEARWRSHGLKRRQQLLLDDVKKGGRTFQVSFGDTSVHRYFSVAHWALEQFHELYQSSAGNTTCSNLEETYVMGYRIISFLTECLPKHPGFATAPDIRQRAKAELELLRECLEDVALQIDEETCNKFVDDFDPLFVVGDDDDDSITESSSEATAKQPQHALQTSSTKRSPERKKMVRFENWDAIQADILADMEESKDDHDDKRNVSGSPTVDTVTTTGTSSAAPLDDSYMNDFSSDSEVVVVERDGRIELDMGVEEPWDQEEDDHDDENAAFPSLHRHYFYRQ